MSNSVELAPDFSRGVDGLLPAIAQDAQSGEVLMLAWMDSKAWQETVQTGRAVYYSRSRKRLWRKGEESGHFQHVVEVRLDCDADTILLRVNQTGAACHEGYATCFFRRRTDKGTFEICQPRLKTPDQIYGQT